MTWNLRCEKEKKYIYWQSIIEIHIRWIKIWGRMEIKNRLLESSSFNRPSDNFLYLMDDFENITRIVSIYQLWTLKSRVKFKLNFSQVDDNMSWKWKLGKNWNEECRSCDGHRSWRNDLFGGKEILVPYFSLLSSIGIHNVPFIHEYKVHDFIFFFQWWIFEIKQHGLNYKDPTTCVFICSQFCFFF